MSCRNKQTWSLAPESKCIADMQFSSGQNPAHHLNDNNRLNNYDVTSSPTVHLSTFGVRVQSFASEQCTVVLIDVCCDESRLFIDCFFSHTVFSYCSFACTKAFILWLSRFVAL